MMKAIQMGAGSFGKNWRKGLTELSDIEVVGLIDMNPQSLKEAADYYSLSEDCCVGAATPEFYDRLQADVLIDSTPHPFHYKNALDAFRSGLHVVTVKPMSDCYESAQTMVEEARRWNRKLVVAQQIRFHEPVLQMRKLIGDGTIGEVAYACADIFFPRKGPVREKWYQPHPLVVECAIHHFDLIRWMLGIEPVSVIADVWNMPWNEEVWGKKTAMALFRDGNGARVLFRGLSTDQEGSAYPGEWLVEGTQGILLLRKGEIRLNGQRIWPSEWEKASFDMMEMNRQVLANALPYFRGEGESVLNGEDNLRSLRMAFATIESAASGARIPL